MEEWGSVIVEGRCQLEVLREWIEEPVMRTASDMQYDVGVAVVAEQSVHLSRAAYRGIASRCTLRSLLLVLTVDAGVVYSVLVFISSLDRSFHHLQNW